MSLRSLRVGGPNLFAPWRGPGVFRLSVFKRFLRVRPLRGGPGRRVWAAVLAAAALSAETALAQGNPPRGSAEEAALFEKHALGVDSLLPAAPPPGGQVTRTLSPGERPSLRFLKKPAPKPSAAVAGVSVKPDRLENALVRPPSDFEAEYRLDADAEVAVAIIGPDGASLRDYRIAAGAPGARAGVNRLSLWDGQDSRGREAPAGIYRAILVTGGKNGEGTQSRVIALRKPAR